MTEAPGRRRIRITISYDGTEYHGWQVQPGLPTIQAAVEAVVSEIEGERIGVESSGRTDAGVHALAQVAAFTIANPIPVENLRKAMNRLLPRDIRVTEVAEAAPEFHPRFDATAKTYEYRILRSEICPPFDRRYVYHHPYPLNEAVMMELAPLMEGEHDFTAYAASDEKDELGYSKVRRIFSSTLERRGELLYGRGAVDMKDTDAMLLAVVRSWIRAGVTPPRDLMLLFMPDEEAGEIGRAHV